MAEAKRRLPLWMLKQKTETKASEPHANLNSEEISEDQIKEKHLKRKQRTRVSEEEQKEEPVKRKQRRKTPNQVSDEFDEEEAEVQRYQRRQPRSKARKKDAAGTGEDNEGITEDVKRKRGKKRVLVHSDDETDLTVDDLVSIAEEYVNADRGKLNKYTASAVTENYPSKDSLKPMPGPRLTKGLLKCSTSKSNTDSSNHALSDKEKLKGDVNIPSNVGKTGDPTQDMLDLFLGPLLKKPPPVKEPTIEPVEEVTSCSVNSIEKTEYKEEKNVEEGRETLVKKRSSLKDKVAMFLI